MKKDKVEEPVVVAPAKPEHPEHPEHPDSPGKPVEQEEVNSEFSFFQRARDANGHALRLTPENVVARARTFVGTPWHHAGRAKGTNGGVDCSGLLIGVMAELGVGIVDDVNYTAGDEYARMLAHLDNYARRLGAEEDDQDDQDGDVWVFRSRRILNHCAIISATDSTMIHAFRPLGCVEQAIGDRWRDILQVRYRYKGI